MKTKKIENPVASKSLFEKAILKASQPVGTSRIPYNRRIYHHAFGVRSDGAVSALCFNPPHPIELGRAFWTTDRSAVTCKKCLELLPLLKVGE